MNKIHYSILNKIRFAITPSISFKNYIHKYKQLQLIVNTLLIQLADNVITKIFVVLIEAKHYEVIRNVCACLLKVNQVFKLPAINGFKGIVTGFPFPIGALT